MVLLLERHLGREAIKRYVPVPPTGDVLATSADISDAQAVRYVIYLIQRAVILCFVLVQRLAQVAYDNAILPTIFRTLRWDVAYTFGHHAALRPIVISSVLCIVPCCIGRLAAAIIPLRLLAWKDRLNH